jgi:hypothetical protein
MGPLWSPINLPPGWPTWSPGRAQETSTCAPPGVQVQAGASLHTRAKCAYCGQWGERFEGCRKCGAPID